MSPLVGLLILILLGLLGSRFGFNPARRPLSPQLVLATGTHFLLLGLLLGPLLGLLTLDIVGQLRPLMALGLGWIGLLFGLQLDRGQLAQFPASYFVFAVLQALITLLLFAGGGYLILDLAGHADRTTTLAIFAAAATAAVSTPAGIALISRTFRVNGPVTRLIFYIASLDALVGIVALQLTYAVFHPSTDQITTFGWGGWMAVATAAGVVFAIFFLWLTRPKPGADELTLFLLGLVVFEAGTALYLGVSPLYVCMITGAIIANLSPLRRRVYTVLQRWEKPVYVVLLIMVGALLDLTGWLVIPLAVLYTVGRAAAKYAGGLLSRTLVPLPFRPPGPLGLGLVPQAGISLAMALSAALTYGAISETGGAPVRAVFGAIVVAVAISEIVGPFLTRDLLRRAGEITPRLETELVEELES